MTPVLAQADASAIVLTIVVCATLVMQTLAFVGLLRAVRSLSLRLESLSASLQKDAAVVAERAGVLMAAIETTAARIQDLQEHVTATAAVIHNRAVELDAFMADATGAARLQIIRIQQTLDTASRRIEDTIELVHHGVLAPVSEVHAVVRGLRVGLGYFLRHRSGRVSRDSALEDEMFI